MCSVLCHLRWLTCKRFNAWALKQSGRAVVIVEIFAKQFEAGVDTAVLLSDFSIVKVCGGGLSCHRDEEEWEGPNTSACHTKTRQWNARDGWSERWKRWRGSLSAHLSFSDFALKWPLNIWTFLFVPHYIRYLNLRDSSHKKIQNMGRKDNLRQLFLTWEVCF